MPSTNSLVDNPFSFLTTEASELKSRLLRGKVAPTTIEAPTTTEAQGILENNAVDYLICIPYRTGEITECAHNPAEQTFTLVGDVAMSGQFCIGDYDEEEGQIGLQIMLNFVGSLQIAGSVDGARGQMAMYGTTDIMSWS